MPLLFLDAFIEYKDTKAIPHQGSIHVSEKMNRNVTDAVSKIFFLCRIDMLHHSGFMTVKSRCILGLWQVQWMVDGTRVEVNLIRTRFPETWILRDRKINQDRTWQTENTTNNKKGPVSFFYLPKKKCSLQVLELMFIQKQEQVLIWEPSTNSTHA